MPSEYPARTSREKLLKGPQDAQVGKSLSPLKGGRALENSVAISRLFSPLMLAQKQLTTVFVSQAIAHDLNNLVGAFSSYAFLLGQNVQDSSARTEMANSLSEISDQFSRRIRAFERSNLIELQLAPTDLVEMIKRSVHMVKRLLFSNQRIHISASKNFRVVTDRVQVILCLFNCLSAVLAGDKSPIEIFISVDVVLTPVNDDFEHLAELGSNTGEFSAVIEIVFRGSAIDVSRFYEKLIGGVTLQAIIDGDGLAWGSLNNLTAADAAYVQVYTDRLSQTTIKIRLKDQKLPPHALESKTGLDKESIFVVDDNALFGRAMTLTLNALGYKASFYECYENALADVPVLKPDLFITDYFLGETTGDQVANSLQLIAPQIPVIAITGQAVGLKKNGQFDMILKKPVSSVRLDKAIQKVLEIQPDKKPYK